MLIVFSGLPGTGKTTIASDLAGRAGAVYLRVDTIEQAIRNAGVLEQDVGKSGYMVANELALRDLGKLGIYASILITFLVSGIWHGAGWNYVTWGVMHAVLYAPQFLGSRTGIRTLVGKQAIKVTNGIGLGDVAAMARVFLLVSLTLIIFRSRDLSSAVQYLHNMASWKTGFRLGEVLRSGDHYLIFSKGLIGLLLLLTMELRSFRRSLGVESIIDSHWKIVLILLAIGLLGTFENTTKFIYFQF